MRAGLLKEKIQIITPQLTVNDYGEQTTEWVSKYNTRARLIHTGGGRVEYNDEIFYSHMKTLEVREYVPVDDFDRIIWNNKQYRILDIEPDEAQMKKIIRIELVND
jgi:head-tail adaptor